MLKRVAWAAVRVAVKCGAWHDTHIRIFAQRKRARQWTRHSHGRQPESQTKATKYLKQLSRAFCCEPRPFSRPPPPSAARAASGAALFAICQTKRHNKAKQQQATSLASKRGSKLLKKTVVGLLD